MAFDRYTFNVERETIQPGLTFSAEAMDEVTELLRIFVGARVLHRWDTSKEPPTALSITVEVEAR